jgi:Uma2 family endonuclease
LVACSPRSIARCRCVAAARVRRGWLFLLGPELHLGAGPDKLNPDIAAWRVERAPSLDDDPIEVVPDWLCEVLSPSTEVYDRATKLPLFAAYGARHAWLLDPDARTLEVFTLHRHSFDRRSFLDGFVAV